MGVHDFESVVAAAGEGAEWAWRRIYDALAPQLAGYLRVRGSRDPDNLVGEVFIQLARNLKQFSGDEAAFRSWVFMIAHHRLLNERRSANRRPEVLGGADRMPQPPVASAEDEAMAHLAGERALALLERLTSEQREVLGLRLIAGLTVEETARALRKSTGAVKQLQRRALASLRREIEKGAVTL